MSPESEAKGHTTYQGSFANRIIDRMLRRATKHRLGQRSHWVLRAADNTVRLRQPLGLVIPTTRAMMKRMNQGPGDRVPERPEMPLARMIPLGAEPVDLPEEPAGVPYEARGIGESPPTEARRLSFDEMTAILQRNTEELKTGRAGRSSQPQQRMPTASPSTSSAANYIEHSTEVSEKPLAASTASQSSVRRLSRGAKVQEIPTSATKTEPIEPQPIIREPIQPVPIQPEIQSPVEPGQIHPVAAHTVPTPQPDATPVSFTAGQNTPQPAVLRLATSGRVVQPIAKPSRVAGTVQSSYQPAGEAIRRELAIQRPVSGEVSTRWVPRGEPEAPPVNTPPAKRILQARVVSREPFDQQPANEGQDLQSPLASVNETSPEPVASLLPAVSTPISATQAPLRRTRRPMQEVVGSVPVEAKPYQPRLDTQPQETEASVAPVVVRMVSNQIRDQPPVRARAVDAQRGVPAIQEEHREIIPSKQPTARRAPRARSKPSPRQESRAPAEVDAQTPEIPQPAGVLAGIPLEEALGLSTRTEPEHSSEQNAKATYPTAEPLSAATNGLEINREPLHQALFIPGQPLSTEQIVWASVARVAREERSQIAPSISQADAPADDTVPAAEVQLIRRRVHQPDEPVATTNNGETTRPVRRSVVVEQVEITTVEQPAPSGAEGASSGASPGAQDSTQAPGGVGQMDIEQLTEEVYRRLRDIIRIEEERYGHQRDRW